MLFSEIYSNTRETDYTLSFFMKAALGAETAALACPFFTNYDVVKLLTERGCSVKLLVRLCQATSPEALRLALADPLVSIKYFTGRRFHAKFYIVDDLALVGSANLTGAGMRDNRELSVLLTRQDDEAFAQLPGLFDDLYDNADQLDDVALAGFEQALRRRPPTFEDQDFETELTSIIPAADPRSTIVGSGRKSKVRAFLQRFKTRYDRLGRALSEVEGLFAADHRRRPEFDGGELDIEISRFLGWVRVALAPGETWASQPPLAVAGRAARISALMVAAIAFSLTLIALSPQAAGLTQMSAAQIRTMLPADQHFSGCNAARAAGRESIPSWDPSYRESMDGDSDGLACEPYRGRSRRW
ncbi:phospholipase D-like domain-containing protein [Caulobacter radicis]|uniref:Phospholipase D n=1 Tax=Caulobacter radicis TaxID=2172650 RepID=A0A2T9JPY5_9CAUL|nr:phospholipase D-like domain-containing protein [Caulobacter radicis]PVM85754.1 hypothetical protein DDF65_06345 [Caulobacter radicis]